MQHYRKLTYSLSLSLFSRPSFFFSSPTTPPGYHVEGREGRAYAVVACFVVYGLDDGLRKRRPAYLLRHTTSGTAERSYMALSSTGRTKKNRLSLFATSLFFFLSYLGAFFFFLSMCVFACLRLLLFPSLWRRRTHNPRTKVPTLKLPCLASPSLEAREGTACRRTRSPSKL